MAKKQVAVSLRKPPPPADLAALVIESTTSDIRELRAEAPQADTFVSAPKSAAPRGMAPGMRAVTLQLPEATVDRLLAFCRLHERELNDVVAEIIAQHLVAQAPAVAQSPRSPAFPALLSLETAIEWVRSRLTIVSSLRSRVLQFAGW